MKTGIDTLNLRYPSSHIQQNIYVKSLGFMCRQEWRIEKAIRVPVRLRLGSLDQCNYLEGK